MEFFPKEQKMYDNAKRRSITSNYGDTDVILNTQT